MPSFIRCGRMVDAVRRPVRSIPVVSRSSVRRSSGGPGGVVFEIILKFSANLRDDTQLFYSRVASHDDNFKKLAEIPAQIAKYLGDVTDQLSKCSVEVSDINRDILHHKEYCDNSNANIEERMIVLENKTKGKLEGIKREIEEGERVLRGYLATQGLRLGSCHV